MVTDTAVFLGDVGHGGSPGGGAARGPLCGLPRFARRHRVSTSWRGTSRRWGEERRVRRTRPRALGGGLTDGMASASVCARGARRDSARAGRMGVRTRGAGAGRRRRC